MNEVLRREKEADLVKKFVAFGNVGAAELSQGGGKGLAQKQKG